MSEEAYLEHYALNRRGVAGWFKARVYTVERWLYILHRVTGVLIILFMLAHFYGLGWHPGLWWDALLGIVVTFHVANGIRLILAEFGWAVGKPLLIKKPSQRPVSIEGVQRYVLIFSLFLFFVLALIWAYYSLVVQPAMG